MKVEEKDYSLVNDILVIALEWIDKVTISNPMLLETTNHDLANLIIAHNWDKIDKKILDIKNDK